MHRAVIHVDMDAFFASVEQRDYPELRGRAVMVGGSGRRGVVAAASYEARQFGVRSAMPAARARRLCPDGVFVKPHFERYRAVSSGIFSVFRQWTSQVEGLSLDEAFLDVSAAVAGGRSIESIGLAIKTVIAERFGLTASVGMAHNKLIAKIASDYDKPDGLVYIRPEHVHRYLDPLPVQRLWGIGPRSAARLNDAGIYTVGQLRQTGADVLQQLFGAQGGELKLRAAGMDERRVQPERERRSVSQETTLRQDLRQAADIEHLIARLSGQVAERLRNKGLYGKTVTIKLRSGGFSTVTRSESLEGYTRCEAVIAGSACGLFRRWADWRRSFALRLVGVGVSGLTEHPDETERLD
ncbi:DNA polymerase IV [Wenzhouxiangella sp. AB-CW3]|uniref:DNA polymerase IV n=1 Tax=Wenzhouxiangella sp. AB-CW3 TaxID=2771012 RepID=UPI00168AC063|nr:DNA polymerase IV [Wenzhouxiangella sp. AB-CW3]QOC24010.1 DNA polymerase IV [Wenzhouxiangella sp. AB-CW3]